VGEGECGLTSCPMAMRHWERQKMWLSTLRSWEKKSETTEHALPASPDSHSHSGFLLHEATRAPPTSPPWLRARVLDLRRG